MKAVARACALVVLVLAGLSAAFAQKPAEWKVDDMVLGEGIGRFEISPDARSLVWVKSVGDKEEDKRVSNLMLTSLADQSEIELTRGKSITNNPRWSPDGKLIAFVTNRPVPKSKDAGDSEKGTNQLWLIRPNGGEPWNITSEKRQVTDFRWLDNETIIFIAQESPAFHEENLKEKKDASVVVDDEKHEPPARLFKITIKDKKITRLTDNTDRIRTVELSPDGNYAVTVHERSLSFTYDQKVRPIAFLHSLKTGDRKQLFEDGKLVVDDIQWARDGKGFFVSSRYSSHPVYLMASISVLSYYEVASGQTLPVDLNWENGLASEVRVVKDGFLAGLAKGARPQFARFARKADGTGFERTELDTPHQGNIGRVEVSADDKTVVYVHSSSSVPPQLFVASLEPRKLSNQKQVTRLNESLLKKTRAKAEVIRWKGARDEEVEGVLYYPHNYEDGKKYPLVLMIHGGPAGADYDSWEEGWSTPQNLMNQRGAFVLKPNYHGSSDYGLKWVESIGGGNYYDLEVPDIEKGVDYLIAKGMVDPDKLGTMGWSNGAILTIALTVNSTRYKVASAGAGDVEWSSDWGNCAFGASFDNYYFGKSPIEDPDLYIRKSPFFKLNRVKTPTIIFFGTEDTSVPTQQGWMHYRALQQLGQTDVRFVLFPGEPHGLQKLTHQRRKIEEELAWFDKYLFGTSKEVNEAIKPDSRMSMLFKLQKASQDTGRFGSLEKGVLVPETVDLAELETVQVGRFEVTAAQYQNFDKTYAVLPGHENDPVHGVTYEQAKGYCEWLSKTTGRNYRLASSTDAESLYSDSGCEENTLDYWAGYSVNPDDASRLLAELGKSGAKGLLLRPVGSFGGKGEAGVFDLGGNVAEWTTAKDGTGKPSGGSADRPKDAKAGAAKPSPDYTGFRVVLEKTKPTS